MSEKKTGRWRNLKGNILVAAEFAKVIVIILFLMVILFLGVAIVDGAIVSVLWNVSIPAMFGLNRVTLFNAFILALTIDLLRSNYAGTAQKLLESIEKENKNEESAKRVSSIKVLIIEIILFLATVILVRYCWNNILPQLINYELIQINFLQALGFSCIFMILFGNSNSYNVDLRNHKEKNENISKIADDDVIIEKVEGEVVLDDDPFFDR